MNKKALVIGCYGQDGSFMSELLYSKGYEVIGVVRETNPYRTENLKITVPNIKIISSTMLNGAAYRILESFEINEVYNFAGVSNVFDAWSNLDEILELNARLPQIIMEAICRYDKKIKYFQASSCLIFGNDESGIQNELTRPNPIYPYGASKLYADNMVKMFREHYGMFCCSGIFYPHESERRGDGFFTKKIARAVAEIHEGKRDKIKVGDLSALRDYGYARDFMEAVYLMMQANEPEDYVIGTGFLTSVEDFTRKCFEHIDLDYKKYIEVDENLIRKKDTNILKADTTKISKMLGWTPKHKVDDIVQIMVNYEILNIKIPHI